MDILIATNNQHKVEEIREILNFKHNKILSLNDIDFDIEIEETGVTYHENAKIKAFGIFQKVQNYIVIADDSGLEIDALNGEPGIYSARFGGENLTQSEKNKKVLKLLKTIPIEKRTARFRSVISLFLPDGENHFFEGVCKGHIGYNIEGLGGFGYDPIFLPSGFIHSLGVLSSDIKNTISHRAQSFNLAKYFLVYSGILQ